ncbi:MAG: CCA tRNA nucleotidyltransferase [Chloroflexales bacterium]|nr:CCA tRNA nucleotidyltransferase [Chloroflexales bacterium]
MPKLVRRTPSDLLAGLAAPVEKLLARAATVAQSHGATLWLVGGVVRDLFLGLPVERDIDLVVEGDAVALAQDLAVALAGRVVAAHDAFGTATVEINGRHIAHNARNAIFLDLAGARREIYPHPAALPVVQTASIAEDLARRDFSINAVVLELHADGSSLQPARLLDPFGGQHDLEAGVLRVLHSASFVDDPTRILRGLRLAARLDLVVEPHTETFLEQALERKLLEETSSDRIRTELCLVFDEPRPSQVLRLADRWGLTSLIFPALRWSERIEQAVVRFENEMANAAHDSTLHAQVYLGLLTYDLSTEEREILIARYRLPNESAWLLRDVGAVQTVLEQLSPTLRSSEIDTILRPFGPAALWTVSYAESSPVSAIVQRYLLELRPIALSLDGHALQRLGVLPGPQLGQLLRALRAARLDGLVTSQAEEETWVREQMRQPGAGGEA